MSRVVAFVDRTKELQLVTEKLHLIKNGGYVYNFILSISGIPGIGKTRLLREAQAEAWSMDIDTVFIDFNYPEVINSTTTYLFQQIADQPLSCVDDLVVDDFSKLVERLRFFLSKKPLLLLIDNGHRIADSNNKLRMILEEVLSRVYNQERLFVVICGCIDLRWDDFELRQRTRKEKLAYFDEEDAKKLSDKLVGSDLSQEIYKLTNGYPAACIKVYEWLTERNGIIVSDPYQLIKTYEVDLIGELVNTILTDYILSDVDEIQVRTRLEKLLKLISPLRRIDNYLLYILLSNAGEWEMGTLDELDVRSYIREMAAQTYLVKYNDVQKKYVLEYPLRRLLSLEMSYTAKDRLLAIHQFSANWYNKENSKLIARDPGHQQSISYLIEHIYHLAQSRQVSNDSGDMETEIQQKLNVQFKGYSHREKNNFYEKFIQDEELSDALGEAYRPLCKFVKMQVEGA